jgi:hypothetical protein
MPDTQAPGNARASNAADQGTSGAKEPTGTAATEDTSQTAEPLEDEQRLDGNAAGGVLGAIFPFEMTMAMATCAGCGTRKPIGAVMAYMHTMGTILRCPVCNRVLIRVAHLRGCYFLDLRGMQVLEVAEPGDASR